MSSGIITLTSSHRVDRMIETLKKFFNNLCNIYKSADLSGKTTRECAD